MGNSGVPVHNALGEVVAALSVVVPNDGHAKTHVPVLVAAAQGVSRALSRHRAISVIRANAPLPTNSSGGCGRFSLNAGKTARAGTRRST